MLYVQKVLSKANKKGHMIDAKKCNMSALLTDILTISDELKKLGVDTDAPFEEIEHLGLNDIMDLYSVSQDVAEDIRLYVNSYKLCNQLLDLMYNPPEPGKTRVMSGRYYTWKKNKV